VVGPGHQTVGGTETRALRVQDLASFEMWCEIGKAEDENRTSVLVSVDRDGDDGESEDVGVARVAWAIGD
jgi:hypothetical protein